LTVAFDASANLWIPNYSITEVYKLPEADLPSDARAATVFTDTQLDDPWFSAIDAEGGVWAANLAGSKVVNNLNSAGVAQGNGYAIPNYAYTVAIDGLDTVWLGTTSGSLAHLSHAGAAISPAVGYLYTGSGSGSMDGLGIDGSGNIWAADWINNALVEWIGVAAPVVTPIAQNLANSPTTIGRRP
jgi:sugar lactone lactonase YvrE